MIFCDVWWSFVIHMFVVAFVVTLLKSYIYILAVYDIQKTCSAMWLDYVFKII